MPGAAIDTMVKVRTSPSVGNGTEPNDRAPHAAHATRRSKNRAPHAEHSLTTS